MNWYTILSFCNQLSDQEGLTPCYVIDGINTTCDFDANGYRLATEAEWEYAARGGKYSKGYKFAGSNDPDEVAWYLNNANHQTHPVGLKKPNELGLYDMSGNANEWCWDFYNSTYYSYSPVDNPKGADFGEPATYRALRGGNFYYPAIARYSVRTSGRDRFGAISGRSDGGIRLVRSANLVMIDIKPDDETNVINLKTKGVLPVAILTTKTKDGDLCNFDAMNIDVNTIKFGPNKIGIAHKDGHPEDVDGDGDIDLLLHFKISEAGLTCGSVRIELCAVTLIGDPVQGYDDISLLGCEPTIEEASPKEVYGLQPAYPNPFNPQTTIRYSLPKESQVKIEIYNLLGQKLETVFEGTQTAGEHQFVWQPTKLPSGIYLIYFKSDEFRQVRKVFFAK